MASPQLFYIISGINKSLAFEWIAQAWKKDRAGLAFILLNHGPSELETVLQSWNIPVFRIQYSGKKDVIRAIFRVVRILLRHKARLVHCHLFDASLIGLLAAKLAGVKKRMYTRHYATFHQVYFPRAVWYDKLIHALATDIVAISENVKQALLREGVSARRIHVIHHGFRLEEFRQVPEHRVNSLRRKYNPEGKAPVIGVISRYFELKGIQFVIPAFGKLLNIFPDAHLVLANASGNYAAEIHKLLSHLPKGTYSEIPFEEDIAALYQLFDVFVHVPINNHLEAFGQTYVEALAAGIPSVFTLSGVATEFVEHGQNALVVPFRDEEAIFLATKRLLEEKDLREHLSRQGLEDVNQHFKLEGMLDKLEKLYKS